MVAGADHLRASTCNKRAPTVFFGGSHSVANNSVFRTGGSYDLMRMNKEVHDFGN